MNIFEQLIVGGILGGSLLIPFVDFITKDVKSPKWSYAIALISSIAMGGIVSVFQGNISLANLNDPTTVLLSLGTVFIASQSIFKLYWQSSLAREKFNQRIGAVSSSTVQVSSEGQPASPIQPQDATV